MLITVQEKGKLYTKKGMHGNSKEAFTQKQPVVKEGPQEQQITRLATVYLRQIGPRWQQR